MSEGVKTINCPQIAMGHGKVDVGAIGFEGRYGILLRPRDNFIPVGEPGELEGPYWPNPADVVIWLDNETDGKVIVDAIYDALAERERGQ